MSRPVERLILECLDREADRNRPELARARSQFTRLAGPAFMEAFKAVSDRHGAAMAIGTLSGATGSIFGSGMISALAQMPTSDGARVRMFAQGVLIVEDAAFESLKSADDYLGRRLGPATFR